MRKNFLMVASSMLLLSLCFSVSHAQKKAIAYEAKVPTYEIGGQVFSFRGDNDLGYGWGAGGRFTYNLNEYIALDNEVNFFLPDEGPAYATQGLFGIKAGKHFKYVGVFAKARPGFQTNLVVNNRDQTRFAFDVGVVGEVYPHENVVLRVDAGDVIIPFGNNLVGPPFRAQRLGGTTHNFQFSMGFGIRF